MKHNTPSLDVRPSPIAGQWYPGSASALRRQVREYLDAAPPQDIPPHSLVALVAPHAGHIYSGGIAAHAYRLVDGLSFDVVAIVSPNHRLHDRSPFLSTAHQAYGTPLGPVPLDNLLLDALETHLGAPVQRLRQDAEHSLEIQLPFLQVALANDFHLLPLMLNDQSAPACQALGAALAKTLAGRNALLVASTDLSHFKDVETAARLDGAITDCIAAFDPQALLNALSSGRGDACGGGPTAAVMLAARALGASQARLLKYATSGDITGDYKAVVGYAAAALYKETAG